MTNKPSIPASPRFSAAMEKAVAHVLIAVDDARRAGSPCLPGIRRMCTEAGVSHVTMWKAVQWLRRSGMLEGVDRRGMLIRRPAADSDGAGSPAPSLAPPPLPAPRWQQVHAAVAEDILAGRYAPATRMPSVKELCRTYGTCYGVLRKALAALTADAALTRHKRGFRVTATSARSPASSVVLVGKSTRTDFLSDLTPRSQEIWQTLERACLSRDVRLEVADYEDFLTTPSPAHRSTRRGPATVTLGYVLRNPDIPSEYAARLIRNLALRDARLAVIDESGDLPVPASVSASSRTRVFSIATSAQAGRAAGEYLLGLGHRRIAYFSASNAETWDRQRFQGLTQAFERRGLRGAVSDLSLATYPTQYAARDGMQASQPFAAFEREYRSFLSKVNPHHDTASVDVGRLPAMAQLFAEFVAGEMAPLFGRAVGDRAITAWIAAYDTIGVAAVRFLTARGVRMPDNVSVMGFDDTFDALLEGMTSYNFGVPALITAVLEFILGGRVAGRRGTERGPVEIPGMVMARRTTGTVPKPSAHPVRIR